MTQISSTFRAAPLLSPRTADYVSAFIQEGDNFDYAGWLQQVQQRGSGETISANECLREDCIEEIAPQIARPDSGKLPASMRLARDVAHFKGNVPVKSGPRWDHLSRSD